MVKTPVAGPDEEGLTPRLDALPAAQRRLWRELDSTPAEFVLYGETALALRLGHPESRDFDFFSSSGFDPLRLFQNTPYLQAAEVVQQAPNTLSCRVIRGGAVLVSFFGGLGLRRVGTPNRVEGSALRIASVLDLAATKVQVVQTRAAARDYVDVDALLRLTDVSLSEAIGAAASVFGAQFNPLPTLKALTSFDEGDLQDVPGAVRRRLGAAVREVEPDRLPVFRGWTGLAAESGS